jgi:hypothetical protein
MSNQRAAHTWFLDTNPATTTLDGLVAGGVFADPGGGLTIRVEALDAMKATIRVDIAGSAEGSAAACLDGTTLAGTGPGPESCAAAPASINGAPPPVIPDGGATGGSSGSGMGGSSGNRDAAGGGGAGGSGGNRDAAGGSGAGGSGTGGSGSGGSGNGVGGSTGGAGGSAGNGAAGSGTGGALPGTGGSNSARGGSGGAGNGTGGAGQDPPVVPGGCGCEVGGADRAPGGWFALAFALTFGLWLTRRSRLIRRRR